MISLVCSWFCMFCWLVLQYFIKLFFFCFDSSFQFFFQFRVLGFDLFHGEFWVGNLFFAIKHKLLFHRVKVCFNHLHCFIFVGNFEGHHDKVFKILTQLNCFHLQPETQFPSFKVNLFKFLNPFRTRSFIWTLLTTFIGAQFWFIYHGGRNYFFFIN